MVRRRMLNLMKEIARTCGPRLAGSEGERRAQDLLSRKLRALGLTVEHHRFTAATTAMFASLRVFCLLYYLSLALFVQWPAIAVFLSLANAIVHVGHHVALRGWLNPLFAHAESSNVIATLEPRGEARTTLVFAGHIDAAREYIFWYWLKSAGAILTIVATIAIDLTPVVLALLWLLPISASAQQSGLLAWAVLSPSTLTLFFIHGTRVVEGAQDNLSGIVVSHAVVTAFADPDHPGKSTLSSTRLMFVSFGAEESGIMGSAAFVRDHHASLRGQHAAVVNLDGLVSSEQYVFLSCEPTNGARYHQALMDQLQERFSQVGASCVRRPLPFGATDGSWFARYGFPTASIIAQPTGQLHKTYHTRFDTVENLDPKVLDLCRDALTRFVQEWDESPSLARECGMQVEAPHS